MAYKVKRFKIIIKIYIFLKLVLIYSCDLLNNPTIKFEPKEIIVKVKKKKLRKKENIL